MPYPSLPSSVRRSSSVASMSSSLNSHLTTASTQSSTTGSGSVYRTSGSGIPRQFCQVHRRSCVELETTSTVAVSDNMKETVDHASQIFMSDLYSQDAWPSTEKKKQLVHEAINQANIVAPTKGNPQISGTKQVLKAVTKLVFARWSCLMFFIRSSIRGC